MNTGKSISNPENSGHPDKARRNFIWKAGAGLSALAAATVPGIASGMTNSAGKLKADVESLSLQLGVLEDEKEIRCLYRRYEYLLGKGKYEEISGLFTNDSEVVLGDDIFKCREDGIHQLHRTQFRSGSTGKRINSAQLIRPDMGGHPDTVEILPDRKTARARFGYSLQVEAPILSDSSLVEMARLQGEGSIKWMESGTCDAFFAKSLKDKTWKIKRLEYHKLS